MSGFRVLIDPHFRTMDEIFDPSDLARLRRFATVVWGRDEPMPADRFGEAVDTVDAVVFGGWRHGSSWLEGSSPPRTLLEVAGGHEHRQLDYDRALAAGIAIGSCAPAFGAVVAEHGLALALACRRGLVQADRRMRQGDERWLHEGNAGNGTLLGARVGFVGCGGISVHLQAMLAPFAVELLGYDPPMPVSVLEGRGIRPASLDEIFASADVVFVLAAPTPENTGLVDDRLLAGLGPHQSVIVLSRASLVDFDALVARSAERGFRFGTDVFPTEPAPKDDPIRSADHGVLSPHLAGALPAALRGIGRLVVDDLEAIAAGLAPQGMQYLSAANAAGLRQTP
ncbi:MAG: NAD(P)-dependent oxidoreductase [Actinomycetota bacterium]